jgi:hypothetical protein
MVFSEEKKFNLLGLLLAWSAPQQPTKNESPLWGWHRYGFLDYDKN